MLVYREYEKNSPFQPNIANFGNQKWIAQNENDALLLYGGYVTCKYLTKEVGWNLFAPNSYQTKNSYQQLK